MTMRRGFTTSTRPGVDQRRTNRVAIAQLADAKTVAAIGGGQAGRIAVPGRSGIKPAGFERQLSSRDVVRLVTIHGTGNVWNLILDNILGCKYMGKSMYTTAVALCDCIAAEVAGT